jgi:hypothetical protein
MTARAIIEDIKKLPSREREKVFAWVDRNLAALNDGSPVPPWHQGLLDERARAIKEGKVQFLDWETAKKQIEAALPKRRFTRRRVTQ